MNEMNGQQYKEKNIEDERLQKIDDTNVSFVGRRKGVSRAAVLSFGFKHESISILSCLNDHRNKHTHYTDLMHKINFNNRNSIFAYYIKRALRYGLITVDRNKAYDITPKGKIVLKMFHKLDEKFLIEDALDLCQNSEGDYEHVFNLVCVNCAYVKNGSGVNESS